jgi:hypothetical protein
LAAFAAVQVNYAGKLLARRKSCRAPAAPDARIIALAYHLVFSCFLS